MKFASVMLGILVNLPAFGANAPQCIHVKITDAKQLPEGSPEYIVQNKIVPAIQKQDAAALAKLFHQRLNVSELRMSTLLKNMQRDIGEFREVSIYRAWQVELAHGDPANILCPEDGLTWITHYGYAKQNIFWLQVMASEELGRIFFSLIEQPQKGWKIGVWHSHQWTHLQKDSQEWLSSARTELSKQAKAIAYLKADLAASLLDGGGQFFLDDQKQILAFRDQIFPSNDWVKHIDRMLPAREEFALEGVSSEFGGKGLGVLLKFRDEEKPRPTASYREFCRKSLSVVYKHLASKELGDGACAFLPRQKLPTDDGNWATYRVSQADL